MSCKTGLEHIASLQDGRTVYIDGKLVEDVTTHPAFRNAVASAALLYDYQARPENIEAMTFLPEGGTRRVNRCWQMPRDYDDLVQRRRALQAWAQVSYGFMGRSPDHVASTLIGQRMGIDVFRKHGPARAKALEDYVDSARNSGQGTRSTKCSTQAPVSSRRGTATAPSIGVPRAAWWTICCPATICPKPSRSRRNEPAAERTAKRGR